MVKAVVSFSPETYSGRLKITSHNKQKFDLPACTSQGCLGPAEPLKESNKRTALQEIQWVRVNLFTRATEKQRACEEAAAVDRTSLLTSTMVTFRRLMNHW